MKNDHSKKITQQPNILNTNTKTLELVVASLFAYAKYSVLNYPQDIVSLNPSSGLSAEI